VITRVCFVFVCGCSFFIQCWWMLSSLYSSFKSMNIICKWFCLDVELQEICWNALDMIACMQWPPLVLGPPLYRKPHVLEYQDRTLYKECTEKRGFLGKIEFWSNFDQSSVQAFKVVFHLLMFSNNMSTGLKTNWMNNQLADTGSCGPLVNLVCRSD
jgi:hypothetical protein